MLSKFLQFLEGKFSIRKIILLPIFIGFITFIISILFFSKYAVLTDYAGYFALFISGFSGLLMIHYKQIPQYEGETWFAVFLGLITTGACWFYLLKMIFENTAR